MCYTLVATGSRNATTLCNLWYLSQHCNNCQLFRHSTWHIIERTRKSKFENTILWRAPCRGERVAQLECFQKGLCSAKIQPSNCNCLTAQIVVLPSVSIHPLPFITPLRICKDVWWPNKRFQQHPRNCGGIGRWILRHAGRWRGPIVPHVMRLILQQICGTHQSTYSFLSPPTGSIQTPPQTTLSTS